MKQKYHLYDEALEMNKEALTHEIFTEAHQWLSTALHYAFDVRSARKLAKVERLAQEQLGKVREHFIPELSPLEPDEVTNYRTLVELAATYRELVKSASHGDGHVVTISQLDGHTFEEATTIDARSGIPISFYTIDGVPIEADMWDTKYITAQEHDKTTASPHI